MQKENKYTVFISPVMQDKRELINISEESSLSCRTCCTPWCRSYRAKLTSVEDGSLVAQYYRPYKCTFLWWAWPEIVVDNSLGEKIGSIQNPCSFCHLRVKLLDSIDNHIFTLETKVLHLGVLCEAMCGRCFKVRFNILDVKKGSTTVSQFSKVYGGCLRECCSNSDSYAVLIPN